jgi:hypothetical protein
VNDLIYSVTNCRISIYADDTKLYLGFHKQSYDRDAEALTADLQSIKNWFDTWQLKISVEKCHVLPLSVRASRPVFEYSIGDSLLQPANIVRDLGVMMDKNLNFHQHIAQMISKAHSKSGLIFRCFKSRNEQFLMDLYKTFVRPLCEYASQVWNPHLIGDIIAVEAVQRRYTKRLPNMPNTPYPDRLRILNLDSLETRRIKADLCEFYKIVNNLSALDHAQFIKFREPLRTRHTHDKQINIARSKTDMRKNSFFLRTPVIWNSLPTDTVNYVSVSSFRRHLETVDLSDYHKCFPDYYV